MKLAALTTLCALALVACGDDSGGDLTPGERGTARDALGGSARTETLARTRLGERPPGELVWVADELQLQPGEAIEHRHELAFAYARRGAQSLRTPARVVRLEAGEGAALDSGVPHRHEGGRDGATLWEIRLARPGSRAPTASRRVFESEPLEGIPEPATASFVEVIVPERGGRTTVHSHPGPEFIYELSGRIDYQNAIVGTKRLGPGGAEGIPPDTAVQKRNPYRRPATFLSLFLVDPDRPFAPGAEF